MDNNGVIVFRALDGAPTLFEGTRFPMDRILDGKIYFYEDIDPDAGNQCRNRAYSAARQWIEKLQQEDREKSTAAQPGGIN